MEIVVACGKSGRGEPFVSRFVRGLEQNTVWLASGDVSFHDDDDDDGNDVWSDGERGSSASGSASSSWRGGRYVTAMCCCGDGSCVATGP